MAQPVFLSVLTLALLTIASADCMTGECPAQGSGLIQRDALRTPTPPAPNYTLAKFIEKILLPKANETHKLLEDTLKAQNNDVLGTWDSTVGAKQNQTNQDLRSIRLNMRKFSVCQRLVKGESVKQEEYCEEWHYAAKNFRPKTLDMAKGNLKTYEKILEKYYQFYPTFMKEKNACLIALEEVHSGGFRCGKHKQDMARFYCGLKKNLTDTCAEYDTAWAEANETFAEVAATITELAEHTKKTYITLQCFMVQSQHLKFATDMDDDSSGAPAPLNSCDGQSFGAERLDIPIATAPAQSECSNVPDVPEAATLHNCSVTGAMIELPKSSAASLIQLKPHRANEGAKTAAAFTTAEAFFRDAEATMEKMRKQMHKQ